MPKIDVYLKALVGALIAGLGAIQTGLADGSMTSQEYVTAAIAFVVALGLVYAIPNSGATNKDEGDK